MTGRILLFSLDRPDIKVTIEAFFDDQGRLVVEGYDIGKSVEEYWGDSDYEYSTTVASEDLWKLYMLLSVTEGDEHALLHAIYGRFNTNTCYSEFQDLLEKNKIHYEGFSWR